MGLHRLIRDYPFARQAVWQFGYSLFWGVQTVDTLQWGTKSLVFWLFLAWIKVTCFLFLSSVSSSLQTLQCFIYGSCSCDAALRTAVRGVGDKELLKKKKGHHTASGAVTRMTGRHPPPPSLPHWGVGDLQGWRLRGNYCNTFTLGPLLST